jgi:hypothetical protein
MAAAAPQAYVQIPPPPTESPVWTDEVWARPVDLRRQIFCNRSLNMKQIKAIGFDMVGACWLGRLMAACLLC